MIWDFPLFPESAALSAGKVDALFFTMLSASGALAIGIFILIIYFVVKYRAGSKANRAHDLRGSIPIEITWSVIPLILLLGVFTWGVHTYYRLYLPPPDALDIYVIGKQWMWKFQHPGGQRELNELHVPAGRPVRLLMTSQDVIHSLFIPAFRIKQDVLPGRYTSLWFEATQPGEYHLFCAEYCGTSHSGMRGRVVVLSQADFDAWLSSDQTSTEISLGGTSAEGVSGGFGNVQGARTMPSAGRKLFQNLGCITCHASSSSQLQAQQQAQFQQAPNLEGLYGSEVQLSDGSSVTADENYIRESILQPQKKIVQGFQPIMPSFQGRVNDEQLLELIAYIKSLSESPGGPK